jgi:hypothetical protein
MAYSPSASSGFHSTSSDSTCDERTLAGKTGGNAEGMPGPQTRPAETIGLSSRPHQVGAYEADSGDFASRTPNARASLLQTRAPLLFQNRRQGSSAGTIPSASVFAGRLARPGFLFARSLSGRPRAAKYRLAYWLKPLSIDRFEATACSGARLGLVLTVSVEGSRRETQLHSLRALR